MEIPIQVAVRIFPLPVLTSQQSSQHSIAHKDANGNSCNNSPTGSELQTVAIKNKAKDKNANGKINDPILESVLDLSARDFTTGELEENGTRCCVQAIPMSSPSPRFTGAVPSVLPGSMLDNDIAVGLVQVGPHTFPVTHALHMDCTQGQIYHQTVFPLISLFLEGFDASVVTYGQRGTGKSYTLFGPGFGCVYGEAEQGVVQRCVHEIFAHIGNHPERTYAVNVGWVEMCGETIRDLLGMGNVHCRSVADVFHWLQVGMAVGEPRNSGSINATHTLFTLTLEQQWVSKEGLIQHRLSTASFSDLCATERIFMINALEQPSSLPKDLGLQALERVVNTLTDPTLMYGLNGNIPYNQTSLTTLLKDSFGGRAQTLLILCISPLERDINETICNLQFAFKVQCVRNFVIMNTFSDDNTPISPEVVNMVTELSGAGGGVVAALQGACLPQPSSDNFGLQFAASQWFKLVSNAEGLFSKLISSNAVSDLDKEQIEEWLFLKQECEECLSSSEAIRTQNQLGPIQEADEPEETYSEADNSCQQNENENENDSDIENENESDSESQRPDLEEKLEILMGEFRHKTDALVKDKYKEFMEKQPKGVMESQESFQQQRGDKEDERKTSVGGRRRSLQPGAILSSAEIAMLNRVASREQQATAAVFKISKTDDIVESSGDYQAMAQLRAAHHSPLENLQKKLRKLDTEIEARQRQIKEVEQTMQLKQNIITELVKNSETRSNAKQRFNKKKAKLEGEYDKSKKQLAKILSQSKVVDKCEIERLRAVMVHLEQRLQDLSSIKNIAGESGQKVKKLQQSLHESKKLLDELNKKLKKERKARDHLEAEMQFLKEKENKECKGLVKLERGGIMAANSVGSSDDVQTIGQVNEDDVRGKHLKAVQARISHLDHVLREKSENLEHETDGNEGQREGLRHEIRNLRRTRDHLLEQRCSLDRKLKREKTLSQKEERKLLECDEAIEAIDAAIEFKNELICGHKSIDTSERLQREKGEQMLMARLNKLSAEEMRTLLYKYFTKVIDLRDSSRKLEMQLMQLERDRDAWEWKERVLSNAVRQARLEGERNAVLLQRQHEMKLNLMLRHLAEETSSSTTSFNDLPLNGRYMRCNNPPPPSTLALAPHTHTHTHSHVHHTHSPTGVTTNTTSSISQFSDTDFDFDFYNNKTKMLKAPKHSEMEICPPLPDALTKYKPLDKFKEKERETKNKLLAKFQVLTRYAGQSISTANNNNNNNHNHTFATATATNTERFQTLTPNSGGSKKKDKDGNTITAAIPQENLKRLISPQSATKVTRQKNKIIIQDASRKN